MTPDPAPSGFDPARPAVTFAATTRNVLLRPASFFAATIGRASYAGPIIYAMACHVLAVLAAGAYDLAFASATGTIDEISVAQTRGAGGGLLWILWLLALTPLYVLVVVFAGAAVYQLLVRLVVGKGNAGYGATLRVTAYLSAVGLIAWMPVLGALIGPWGVWINATGLRQFHRTTTPRAILIAAIPYAISLAYSIIWVASGQSTFWEFLLGGGTMFPTE